MTRAGRWIELGTVFGLLPVVLALYARALALPVLFVAAWVCLALLWRDPTFQRDELWRREQLWTCVRPDVPAHALARRDRGGHAAYGCLLFTVGLGRWFVTGV